MQDVRLAENTERESVEGNIKVECIGNNLCMNVRIVIQSLVSIFYSLLSCFQAWHGEDGVLHTE